MAIPAGPKLCFFVQTHILMLLVSYDAECILTKHMSWMLVYAQKKIFTFVSLKAQGLNQGWI